MADIKPYLDAIMEAEYGEQVRGSIHDAIKAINDEVQEGGGGIKELVEGTPTDIDGILEGKDGVLQKMTIPPPIYTGYWSTSRGNYKKFMEFTFDASQRVYPRFEMAFIFSHSMGGFPYTPRYYISINPGNTFSIVHNSYISSWNCSILGVTYSIDFNEYKCELWWGAMEPLPSSANTYYITELMAPPWLKFNFLPDGEEKTSYEWSSEYTIGKNVSGQNNVFIRAFSAEQLDTPRTLELSGDITGSTNVQFDSAETINTSINWSSVGEIPIENIPKGALEKPKYVYDETEMLLLNIDDVQNGDTVVLTKYDPAHMYLVVRDDLLGTMQAFEQYKGGAASSVAWQNVSGRPESIVQTINGAKADEIGNIEIGGRNYLVESDKQIVKTFPTLNSNTWSVAYVKDTDTWTALFSNKTVTVSADYECNITSGAANFAIDRQYNTLKTFSSVDNGKGRIKTSIVLKSGIEAPSNLSILFVDNHELVGTLSFSNLKLELGSVATDWTPAPEDKQDKLTGTAGQVVGFNNKGEAVAETPLRLWNPFDFYNRITSIPYNYGPMNTISYGLLTPLAGNDRPYGTDCAVLHMRWDNNNYAAQLAVGLNEGSGIYHRIFSASGEPSSWQRFLTEKDATTLELAAVDLYETMLQIKPDLAVSPSMIKLYNSLVQKNELSISQINPKIQSSVTKMIKMEETENERTISE